MYMGCILITYAYLCAVMLCVHVHNYIFIYNPCLKLLYVFLFRLISLSFTQCFSHIQSGLLRVLFSWMLSNLVLCWNNCNLIINDTSGFLFVCFTVSSPDLSNDHLILNSLTSFVPCLRKSMLIVYIFLINIQTLLMAIRNVYVVIFFSFLFVLAIILISLHNNLYITFFFSTHGEL